MLIGLSKSNRCWAYCSIFWAVSIGHEDSRSLRLMLAAQALRPWRMRLYASLTSLQSRKMSGSWRHLSSISVLTRKLMTAKVS